MWDTESGLQVELGIDVEAKVAPDSSRPSAELGFEDGFGPGNESVDQRWVSGASGRGV